MSEIENEISSTTQENPITAPIAGRSGKAHDWTGVAASLIVPIAWGLTLYFLLSSAFESGWFNAEWGRRYLFGHPVSKITTAMFCVGLASLAGIALDVLWQIRHSKRIAIGNQDLLAVESDSENDLTADQLLSQRMLNGLKDLPVPLHQHWLHQRLVAVLNYIHRNGATEGTESELKYLAESDQMRQQQRYSLVRILIWATPMLGFLGTVMGISQALGGLNVGPENDLQKMMGGLQSSLYVAFDTTAQALVFSIGLMFVTFICERFESHWLSAVDQSTTSLISQHFEFVTPANEASQSVYRLGRRMVAATRSAVQEHTEIWRQTINAAEQAWHGTQWNLSSELQTQWAQAIRQSLDDWSIAIDRSTAEADERMALRWSQWQTTLSEFARTLEDRQRLASQQTVTVNEILGRLENLGSIHQAINQNLESLHSTTRLETALTGLTQVIGQLRWEMGQSRQEHAIAASVSVQSDLPDANEIQVTLDSPKVPPVQHTMADAVPPTPQSNVPTNANEEPIILKHPSLLLTPTSSKANETLPRPHVIRLSDGARRAA